ncbi:MAG: SigE family RNA polymerase sigma factor [Propionibacteriales bacterium]|nr:SigE family RNA polymerase sigma factor [Propionibacteriales bacterium]
MRRPDWESDFEEFVLAAWQRLRRAAYLMTGSHHDAEDLVQSVLAKMYASWPRVRNTDVYAYAWRSLLNANIDRSRRRRFIEVHQFPEVIDQPPEPGIEHRDQIVDLLASLTQRERAMVVLRYYCDASVEQVADHLGVSEGTVKSVTSRALAKLRVQPSSAIPEGNRS